MHPRLLSAICLTLCLTVGASGQQTTSGTLSGPLRAHLQNERFDVVTSIRGLPLDVRNELQKLWSSATLDIAEPGTEFQRSGGAANPQLPSRRLIAAGCAQDNHCLVYYERGGAAASWHVMLFHWTPETTKFEWGGTAPGGLATIADVRKAVLSGAIKDHSGSW
jgi:hypothetical protein